MRFSKLLNTLQNLIGFTPKQSDIGKILNMGYSTINGRYQRDSDFSDEEIDKYLLNVAMVYYVPYLSNEHNTTFGSYVKVASSESLRRHWITDFSVFCLCI